MRYKKEFLNIFEKKENIELAELLSSLVKPFEDKFNKDLSQFNVEEVRGFNHGIIHHEKHRELASLIMTYARFVQEMNRS